MLRSVFFDNFAVSHTMISRNQNIKNMIKKIFTLCVIASAFTSMSCTGKNAPASANQETAVETENVENAAPADEPKAVYKINTIALKFMNFFDFSSHFSYNDSMLQPGPQIASDDCIPKQILKGDGFYASYTYQ